MLARRLSALLLALLFVPQAAAFASRHDAVELAYAATKGPVVLGLGNLSLEGRAEGAILAANVASFAMRGVPQLTIVERGEDGLPRNTTLAGASLLVESGSLLWRLPEGGAHAQAWADYGIGLGLARAPVPAESGESVGAGTLLVGPSVSGLAQPASGGSDVLALHATVTILDNAGQSVPGWLHRAVNANGSAQTAGDASGFGVVFHAEGAADGVLRAAALGMGAGTNADLALAIAHAPEDKLKETLDTLNDLSREIGGPQQQGGDSPLGGGSGNPLEQLEAFSPLFNGAVLVIQGGDKENATEPPRTAKIGDDALDLGPITFMRSGSGVPMRIHWDKDEMRVEGEPTLAVTQAGFAVDRPATVWIIPIVSLVLWLCAIAAIVLFFVKRPPEANAPWSLRLVGWGVWLVVLLLVFVVWDKSFAESFGTSALSQFMDGSRDWPKLGILLSMELVPWSLAGLLFALPVRIALGVGLRYLGKGKALKSFATAGGLVALAIFGPMYALYIVNVGIQQAIGAIGH